MMMLSFLLVLKSGFSDNNGTANMFPFLKFPSHQFRPSQADILHFDLWVNGENEKGREGERENKIKGEWRAGIQGVMVE